MTTKLPFITKEEAEKLLAKAIAKFNLKSVGFGEYVNQGKRKYRFYVGWYPSPHLSVDFVNSSERYASITSEEQLNDLRL